jgi:hypothetical protein
MCVFVNLQFKPIKLEPSEIRLNVFGATRQSLSPNALKFADHRRSLAGVAVASWLSLCCGQESTTLLTHPILSSEELSGIYRNSVLNRRSYPDHGPLPEPRSSLI